MSFWIDLMKYLGDLMLVDDAQDIGRTSFDRPHWLGRILPEYKEKRTTSPLHHYQYGWGLKLIAAFLEGLQGAGAGTGD